MLARLLCAAALLLLAECATPSLTAGRSDRLQLETLLWAQRYIEESPRRASWLVLGDSTANSDIDVELLSRRLGTGPWLRIGSAANLATEQSAVFLEEYLRRRGAPAGVLVVHAFPAWSLEPRRMPPLTERLLRSSALLRLGETVGEELGVPDLGTVERAVAGPPSRNWRRFLGVIPPSARRTADRLSTLSREHGFPLVFVETPIRAGALTPEELAKRGVARELLSGRREPFVAFQDEAPSADMRDDMHMTREARRVFTERLARYLSSSSAFRRKNAKGLPAIKPAP